MKTKIIILLIAGFGILLNGCKKYDEGANISLRSKKGRVEGNWDVTVCKVDGQSAFNYSDTWNYYSFDCGQNFSVTETNKINNCLFILSLIYSGFFIYKHYHSEPFTILWYLLLFPELVFS